MSHYDNLSSPEHSPLDYLQNRISGSVSRIIRDRMIDPNAHDVAYYEVGEGKEKSASMSIEIAGTDRGLKRNGCDAVEVGYVFPSETKKDAYRVIAYGSDGTMEAYELVGPSSAGKHTWTSGNPERSDEMKPVQILEADRLHAILGSAMIDAGLPPEGIH